MYMTRRALLGASAAGAVLVAAGCSRPQSGDLHAILDAAVTDFLRESPEYATSLAVPEEQAGGRYIDRLSDASRESIARQRAKTEDVIRQLGTVNRETLNDQDRVTLDVVTTALQNNVEAGAFVTGQGAQAPYTITQLTGSYNGIPDFLVQQHPVRTRDEADAYLTRLSAFAGVLDQETARVGQDESDGVVPPGFVIDRTLELMGAFTAIAPAQNRLVTAFQQKLAGVADIPDADKAAMAQRAECVMLNKGGHALEAVQLLDNILHRMDNHVVKKSPLLGPLSRWTTFPPSDRPNRAS